MYAFVGTYFGRIAVIDISDPANPFEGGYIFDHKYEFTYAVLINEPVAYIGATSYPVFEGSIAVLDISTPIAPVEIGRVSSGELEDCYMMVQRGDYLYVAAGEFVVVDVSDPTNPIQVGHTMLKGGDWTANGSGVQLKGNYTFVSSSSGNCLSAIDISDPANPTEVDFIEDAVKLDNAGGVYIVGDYAFVCAREYLTVVDISNPLNLLIFNQLNSADFGRWGSIDIKGDYAYLVTTGGPPLYLSQLVIVNVSDPSNLSIESTLLLDYVDTDARSIEVKGDYAYIACDADFRIINISDPTSPSLVGSVVPQLPYLDNIEVSGNYLFATTSDGITVIDIATPSSPSIVTILTLDRIRDTRIHGGYLYCISSTIPLILAGTLSIIDISNPLTLSVVGSVTDAALGYGQGIDVVGNYAYIACDTANRLTIVDISVPTAPVVKGSVASGVALDGASLVRVHGNYAFVGMKWAAGTLTVVDVSNPLVPSIVTSIISDRFKWMDGMDCDGSYLYTTNTISPIGAMTITDIKSFNFIRS